MAEDFDALVADLTNNARYDAAVRSGSNDTVTALLNEADNTAAVVFDDVPIDDIQEAAGQVRLAALTPSQQGRLRTLRRNDDTVATSKPGLRAELLDVFGITEAVLVAGVPAVRRRLTFGEAFGYRNVSLNTVQEAVLLIAKSSIATHHAAMAPITAARTQRLVDAGLDVATTPDNMVAKSNV